MNIELPLYAQEERNTCALACLRMILAAYGTRVDEVTLRLQVRLDPEGTHIDELRRLAQRFGLVAEIEEPTIVELGKLLSEGKLAIAYIDRSVFDMSSEARTRTSLKDAKIHNVVPTRMSAASIWYHDPLPPRRMRKSLQLFRLAYERLGNRCVVRWKA